MKNLILTSVVSLLYCFTAFGQSAGKCQPKCGSGNAQSASVYNMNAFDNSAVTKKCGGAESPRCGVADVSKVNYSLTQSCTPATKCGVAGTTNCKPAVAQKSVTVKPKSKAIAKL